MGNLLEDISQRVYTEPSQEQIAAKAAERQPDRVKFIANDGTTWGFNDKVTPFIRDYMYTGNSAGLFVANPRLFGTSPNKQKNINWGEHLDLLQNMSEEDKNAILSMDIHSEYDLSNVLQRRALFKESQAHIANDNLLENIVGYGLAGAVDPLVGGPFTEGIGAVGRYFKISSSMGALAKSFAVNTGIGIGSLSLQNYAFKEQGLPTQDANSILFNGLLMGAIGTTGTAFNLGAAKAPLIQKAAHSLGLKSDDFVKQMIKDDLIVVENYEGETPKIKTTPLYKATLGTIFDSDTNIAWGSEEAAVRDIVSKLNRASTAVYDAEGKPIPAKIAARDMIKLWSGDAYTLKSELLTKLAIARENGYTGSRADFMEEIGRDLKLLESKQNEIIRSSPLYEEIQNKYERGLKKALKDLPEEEHQKIIDEFEQGKKAELEALYDQAEKHLETVKVYHPEAVKAVREYYRTMLERGQKLNVPELMHISPNKIYTPRVFDFYKIEHMEHSTLVNIIKKGLMEDPDNIRKGMTPIDYTLAAEAIATDLKKAGFSREYADYRYIVPKSLPVSAHLKGRKLKLHDAAITEILDTNVENNVSNYAYWQNKQYGIRWAFPELQGAKTGELGKIFKENYIDKIDFSKATPREVDALNNVFNDILGTYALAADGKSFAWKASRTVTGFNSLTMLGNSGFTSLTEIASALWSTGAKVAFFKEFLPSIFEAQKMMFSGKTSSKATIQAALSMGSMHEILSVDTMSRVAEFDGLLGATTRLERFLVRMNEGLFKWNGLKGITAGLESVVFGNAMVDFLRFADEGVKEGDIIRLSKWGLSPEEAVAIGKELNTVGIKENGFIIDPNFKDFNPELKTKFQVAVNTAIESGVMQGDTMHLPSWMREANPFTRMLFQFMRTPLAQHNYLTRRMVDGEIAGLVTTAATSMMIYMGITYLRDQAMVAAGLKDKPTYDLSKEESWLKLLGKGANYSSASGGLSDMFGKATTLLGVPTIGKEYGESNALANLNPTFGMLQNLNNLSRSIQNNGVDSQKTFNQLQGFIPGGRAFLVGDVLNTLSDKYLKP